ncbi:MAG: hypothetical protein Q8934_19960 [Bacillota bacterium]|nr:hypothetical protein [Bacillota bacterium]
MNKKTKLFFILLLFSSGFIIPTSVHASTFSNQNTSFFYYISNYLSSFQTNKTEVNNQIEDKHNWNNEDDNWWNCFKNWWDNDSNDHDYYNGGHDGWGNDDGSMSSDEIWKKWYCH